MKPFSLSGCRAVGAIVGLALTGLAPAAAVAACSKPDFRIVLDVGHSAMAPGATSARGVTEYDFNVKLSALVERTLRAAGYPHVLRMLTPGPAATLLLRAAKANAFRPDLFLSLHHDSAQARYLEPWTYEGRPRLHSDRFKGWSLFVSLDNDHSRDSRRFASLIADRLLAHGLPFSRHHAEPISGEAKRFLDADRGIYEYDGLVVLKRTHAPAVLLESGLIINRDEEVALAGPERQGAIAESITGAVDSYCDTR